MSNEGSMIPILKKNAVNLTEESGRTVKEAAENLGTAKDLLYRWRREYRLKHENAFPGHGKEALTNQEK